MILSVMTKAFGVSLILFGCAVLYILILKRRINQRDLLKSGKDKEIDDLQGKMLEDIKKKVIENKSASSAIPDKDDIKARVLYNQNAIKELGDELKIALQDKHVVLSGKYPKLTDLDLLVIDLIIIGMDNDDICEIIKMEKRTLYRRRQLIAQRIGISSNDIEAFVRAL